MYHSRNNMRDTNDMMEDAICEDTMMECSGDGGGGLEDLVNLASDIADSAPSIRDAAERLLTLLGVDEDDDASSSEDEGVEVDLEDSDGEDHQDTRLLHQLAASLAQELKYAKQNSSNTKLLSHNHNHHNQHNHNHHRHNDQSQNISDNIYEKDIVQSMEFGQEVNQVTQSPIINFSQINLENSNNQFGSCNNSVLDYHRNELPEHSSHISRHPPPPPPPYEYKSSNSIPQFENRIIHHNNHALDKNSLSFGTSNFDNYTSTHLENGTDIPTGYVSSTSVFHPAHIRIGVNGDTRFTDPVSWGVGWDACASETLRYLVEDEGLPPHHPTVVAMKNHLDLQRSRAVPQFAS